MITIKDKKDCCGCTACYNACPKKAIAMQADQEGFLWNGMWRCGKEPYLFFESITKR